MATFRSPAHDSVMLCEWLDPERIFCHSPGLCRLSSARPIETTDWGGTGFAGVAKLADDKPGSLAQTDHNAAGRAALRGLRFDHSSAA